MDLQQSRWRSQRDAMDSQHQSGVEALSEVYSPQGRTVSRDNYLQLHPAGGMGKERQGQGPIEQRTQTRGEGRQGHDHFLRAVRQILPPKRWRKRTKQHRRRRDMRSYGADRAEPVTGYPAAPYGGAKAETVTIYPSYLQAVTSSHPWPYPPLQHNPPLYPSQEGYPPPPPYSQDYNNGPPNQGYQPFPPTYSQGYLPPSNQGYHPFPPPYPQVYNRPPNQGHYQLPPPYPQGYSRPPNQSYQTLPLPPNQGYQNLAPPPNQGYLQHFQNFASSVAEKVSVAFIENDIGTFFSDVNSDGSSDGGSFF